MAIRKSGRATDKNHKTTGSAGLTIAELTALLGVREPTIRRYLRIQRIPLRRVFGQRKRLVDVHAYAVALRKSQYDDAAACLESWLEEQQVGAA